MKCEKCGEELPARARFCLTCGAPVVREGEAGEPKPQGQAEPAEEGAYPADVAEDQEDGLDVPVELDFTELAAATAAAEAEAEAEAAAAAEAEALPASHKLEEPLEPMGVGAIPLVPIAPPPRASRVMPRSARTYARESRPGPASVATRAAFRVRNEAAEEYAAQKRAEAGEPPAEEPAAPTFSERLSELGTSVRGLLGRMGPQGVIGVVACVAVAALAVSMFMGLVSTSWLGPFAPPSNAPQVQPPSDGSIGPLGADEQDDETPQDEDSELPEGAPQVRQSVEDYSWEELSQISALIADANSDEAGVHLAAQYNLCSESGDLDGTQAKSLELSDGTVVDMRIAGFRQDQKADGSGAAGITFIAAEGVSEQSMNATGQLYGGWEESTLRAWMNQSLIGQLPTELSELIVTVEKRTNPPAGTGEVGQDVTADMLWVPSYSEIVGQPGAGSSRYGVYESEGDQYTLFYCLGVDWTAPSSELVIPSGRYWWQRSPDVTNGRWFMVVSPEGQASYGHRPATENAILMGFCL